MAKPRGLLQRLLNTPDLAAIVPRLEPEVLRRVIQACGLEDCADFVALATPEQLARVLDSDVWRTRVAGADEEFDPERFGVWLTVLMEAGAAVAAEKLAGLEIELVIAGLAHHVAVIDYVAAAAYTTLDGVRVPGRTRRADLVSELGGYVIEARRTSAWEPIVELFTFLASERPEYFHRVMRECVRLSDGAREEDGFHDLLDDREQDMFDLAAGREAGREERGYVAPAQARAFLHEARAVRIDADRPSRSAIVRAHFRAIQPAVAAKSDAPAEPDVSAIFELLEQAEPLSSRPRALLGAADGQPAGLSFVHAHAASHPASEEELAYLANAIVAGCSVQGRPFTIREASDCAVRVCNLGLENWPPHWSERDLIAAFQVGWTILHRDVCLYAAERLIDVLAAVRCSDRDVQLRLDGLRRKLIQHRGNRDPWHVGDALDAILILDAPCWAALRGLIDECPVIHAALRASRQGCRTINPADFEFISENTQIAAVREFLTALPTILAG
jgi:hypothetical protein